MAVIQLHYHPAKLGISTSVSVVLPVEDLAPGEKLPVLWLLHGGGGSHLDFLYDGNFVRYAKKYRMAIVMPDGQNSSWVDMTYGPSWETYITEGLPEYICNHFPVSSKREDNMIAGISMGGYGALHAALHHPEKYAAACGMGSGVWLPMKYANGETKNDALATLDANLEASFGSDRSKVIGSEYDCLHLAKEAVRQGKQLPRLMSCCGRQDFSYQENMHFWNELQTLGIDCKWLENDGGHDDRAWDFFVAEMFRWLREG